MIYGEKKDMQDRQWLVAIGIGVVFVFGVTLASIYVGFKLGQSTVEERTVVSPTIRVSGTHLNVQPPNVNVTPQNLAINVKPPTVEVQVKELTEDLGTLATTMQQNQVALKELQETASRTLKELALNKLSPDQVKSEVKKVLEQQLVKTPEVKEKDPDGELLAPPKK